MKRQIQIFLKCSLLSFSLNAAAINSENTINSDSDTIKGFEIAARNDRSDRGFIDSEVNLTMVLRNAVGMENTRILSLKTYEIPDESMGDKSLIVFKAPADINGTALLSHTKILEPDYQWLYLPALKRTKRISSVNKSGPFVGSEFAFEDLTSSELNKYNYRFIREEQCGKLKCDVIERLPKYQYSGYSKQVCWIDQEVYQIRKIDFFDRKGTKLKTLIMDDYRIYKNKYWRPHRYSMKNHQSEKSTELIYSEYHFKIGLKESDFIKKVLNRLN